MNFLLDEFLAFLNIGQVLAAYKSGGWSSLMTVDGILLFAAPAIPFLILLELLIIVVSRRFKFSKYKVTTLTYMINVLIGKVLAIDAMALVIKYLSPYTLFQTSMTWYWFIYSYVVWELAQFIYHYSSHKIRILWCAHSTHHAPEHINLSVAYTGFFLQGVIAYAIRGSVCIMLGLSLPMLALVMLIDGLWGGMVHISEELLPDGRLGFLEKWILTPQHHRIHHARNPQYIDKNFCNLLSVWDHVFHTFQPALLDVKPDYGIARKINANSFIQVYFSEFYFLLIDVLNAKGIKNKLSYIFMPPGWVPKST